jgi:hypothetical protein
MFPMTESQITNRIMNENKQYAGNRIAESAFARRSAQAQPSSANLAGICATRTKSWQVGSSLLPLAALLLLGPVAAHAQTAGIAVAPANTQNDQYSGVSHPPSDDEIVANDDAVQAQAKPMPGVRAGQYSGPTGAYSAPTGMGNVPTAPQAAQAYAGSTGATEADNPEDGVITQTTDSLAAQRLQTPQANGASFEQGGAHLISRPTDPSYGIVGMVPSPSNQLAEGTDISVRLMQPLSSNRTQDGELFRAQVDKDVYKEGRVVIPMGSVLRGRVTQVSQGHRLGGRATIHLRPDDVILPDGTAYHLYAQAIASKAPGSCRVRRRRGWWRSGWRHLRRPGRRGCRCSCRYRHRHHAYADSKAGTGATGRRL